MSTIRRKLGAVVLGLSVALSVSACTNGDHGASTTQNAETAFPDTAVGQKSQWVVGQLNESSSISVEEWDKALAASITDDMSAEQILAVLEENVIPHGPFELVSFQESKNKLVAELLGKKMLKMTLVLDSNGETITGIYFAPVSS